MLPFSDPYRTIGPSNGHMFLYLYNCFTMALFYVCLLP